MTTATPTTAGLPALAGRRPARRLPAAVRPGATREALAALGAPAASTTVTQRAVDAATGLLSRRTSRRGFLIRTGVVGTALAADPFGFVLKPGTAYASVCGPGSSCTSGWTAFCATVNKGVNACPPGSIAAGWWKADGASLCGGSARYIIDCNATCSRCHSPGARAGICDSSCWSCSCTCGPGSSCDQRRVCCNAFRYGQCNTQISQVGAVQCRVVSCTPPWQFENCTTSPATDNRTRDHSSSELPTAFTPISQRYIAIGENGSALGATVYGELPIAGGTAQRYQKGRISYAPATGAIETVGTVSTRYVALGGEAGRLGFPTAAPQAVAGGTVSTFQHGRIVATPATGAWEVVGAVADRYLQAGAEDGTLGFPVSGDTQVASGRFTRFQHGRISAKPGLGAFVMGPQISDRYSQLGGEGGRLGFPVADEQLVRGETVWYRHAPLGPTVRRVRFEHGTLTYDPVKGTVS